jgi:hypothetical protein
MHLRDTSYTIKLTENTVFVLQDRRNNTFGLKFYYNVVSIYEVTCTIDFTFCWS